MNRALGVLLLIVAAASGAVGVLWALLKTIGAEWDYCRGGSCTSGYAGAAVLLAVAAVATLAGLRLLRPRRRRPGTAG